MRFWPNVFGYLIAIVLLINAQAISDSSFCPFEEGIMSPCNYQECEAGRNTTIFASIYTSKFSFAYVATCEINVQYLAHDYF